MILACAVGLMKCDHIWDSVLTSRFVIAAFAQSLPAGSSGL